MAPVALGRRLRRKARARYPPRLGQQNCDHRDHRSDRDGNRNRDALPTIPPRDQREQRRKDQLPAAFAALSDPIVKPLLATNQRFAIAAAIPTAPPRRRSRPSSPK